MTNDNSKPEPAGDDILQLLDHLAESLADYPAAQAAAREAAKVIEWGRRRDAVLTDTLSDLRKEFFNLAVQAARDAKNSPIMDRRRDARALAEDAKNKVRYIENVLAYTGEKPVGDPKPPVAPALHQQ